MPATKNRPLKIVKVGNSAALRIPKHVLTEVGLGVNDPVSVRIEGEKIIITKQKPRVTIEALLEKYSGTYDLDEVDWGKPEGKEVW